MTFREEKKKTVLVGIRMDGKHRLLLNWTLVKVAEPGDLVIALHVCTRENRISLDDYLEIYEGLCNARKLVLIGKVSCGKSVRKTLVMEAKLCDAMIVVVGIKSQTTFRFLSGCWVSIANYCANKLPPTTTVLAVNNGKVVFHRGFTTHLPEVPMSQTSETLSLDGSKDGGDEKKHVMFNAPELKNENPSSLISCGGLIQEATETNSIDELIKKMEEFKPGWPLLNRASSVTPGIMKESTPRRMSLATRNMSVVQWAMSLPKRTSPSATQTETDFESDKIDKEVTGAHHKSKKSSLSAWGVLPKELDLLLRTNSSRCRLFSYKELMDATSQFSSGNLIAKGGCSRVYKGYLLNGKKVAIKIMPMSNEGWKAYILEVDIISSLNHKNIIPLLGVCLDENELILVYDFLSNGSLEENLHGTKESCGLSWEVRFNVAVGIAEALNYLHKECSRPVIHRDIKSANILLSDEFEPQLSDFGLAVWASTVSSEVHTDVVGTFGYLAPEYFMYGKISEKIDVYSFGVVLLELLSGKKPITSGAMKGQESLVMWAKPILESEDATRILDPNLSGRIDEVQMQRMILAVKLCIKRTARVRPEMEQILKLLVGETDVRDWMGDEQLEDAGGQCDDEVYPDSCAESHLGVALLDLDDNTTSFSSVDDYLRSQCSRSSSFQ